MMGSGSGGGRRIASSTRGGGGMSFPEVRQTKDILRYGRNTQIVQYKRGQVGEGVWEKVGTLKALQ